MREFFKILLVIVIHVLLIGFIIAMSYSESFRDEMESRFAHKDLPGAFGAEFYQKMIDKRDHRQ
jgi:hypothetical protein